MSVPQHSVSGLCFSVLLPMILFKSSTKFSLIMYADNTTLNSTLDNFETDQVGI